MCKLMEEFAYKCRMEGVAEATAKNSREIAIELWKDGIRDFGKISKLTHLPLNEVKELFKDEIK